MIISLNWLKQYVDIDVPVDELATLIGARLVEIEETIDLGEKYKDSIIVKVEKCEKIKESDHLSLTFVDDCGIMDNVDRDKDGLVQVVCGANNVKAGMLAVWLPPESTVPETYDDEEPFVLGARKLCGRLSNGMLASIRELGLGDDHDGIVEINPADAKPGDSFAKTFSLDDVLFDIENKSLTHRPDCFGVLGFAREVAGILGKEFTTPDFMLLDAATKVASGDAKLKISIEDAKLCPRYQAVIMDLSAEQDTKYLTLMQTNIARSGMRSIDPVVDSTNDLMLLTGQPLHAFDYDKLVKVGGKPEPEIVVRAAKAGEKLELLDGKTIEMAEGDIVITSNNVPVALAGAMGGANTMIDENTKRIIVESATFNLYNLRGTQFRHGIFSEAITRFTKGQPPALTEPVINKFVAMTEKHYGLKAVSPVFDAYPEKIENQSITLTIDGINSLLGVKMPAEQIKTTLQNVGFDTKLDISEELKARMREEREKGRKILYKILPSVINVTAPYWRTDIHIKEDVIEEIGRLSGFDDIPAVLPQRGFEAVELDALSELKSRIRASLSGAGANEVLTYSFIHGNLLEKVGQNPANSYKLVNSISPNLEYVRQQIVPSLLEKTYENSRAGYSEFALYELNQVFLKNEGLDDEKVPKLRNNLGLVVTDGSADGSIFYVIKKYVETLAKALNVEFRFEHHKPDAIDSLYEPKRSADVYVGDVQIGVIGEVRGAVVRNMKLPARTAAGEFDVDLLQKYQKLVVNLPTISRYPSVERDICFKVKQDVLFADLSDAIKNALSDLNSTVVPIDIYQKDGESTKNITFRVSFSSSDKTLDKQDITEVVDKITAAAKSAVQAEII
ncbi:phenylalanine--tRNA ligase beta subunit [Alphaproteobacteria bacterium]|nr:phenylalanine--tRNA ligase beta subunit [Alphaproteobacteria bacterium]